MERLERHAIILSLIEHMEKEGSWCGETHIQKACYLLERLFDKPLNFDFILYRHGPYSFELSDELTAMRADLILELYSKFPSYGPSFRRAGNSKMIKDMYPKTIEKHESIINFVAEKIGSDGVLDLEKLSTALYVTSEKNSVESVEARSNQIHQLKPHITIEEAYEAVINIDLIVKEAEEI